MRVGDSRAPHGVSDADRDGVDRLVVTAEFADSIRDRETDDLGRRLPWVVHCVLPERPDLNKWRIPVAETVHTFWYRTVAGSR